MDNVRIGSCEGLRDVGAIACERQKRMVVRVGEGPGQEQLASVVSCPGQRKVFLTKRARRAEVVVDELIDQHPPHATR